jgi:hypothetical protein
MIAPRGHGDRLRVKWHEAIEALLIHKSVAAAARAIGVCYATLNSWLKHPQFAAAYEEACKTRMEKSLNRLLDYMDAGGEALRQQVHSPDAEVVYRAASTLQENGLRALEIAQLTRQAEEQAEAVEELAGAVPLGNRFSKNGHH